MTSAGATTTELRAGLQGLARLRFRNGVVHGIDIGAAMKEWRSLIPGRQTARRPHREAETTTFDEVTASFQIGKGIARNSDLQAKSGVFRVTGAGDIDLVESRIDYLSRVTLLVVPVGPDSGLLASLRGITVPIRVKGPLAAPEWHLEAALPTVSSAVSAGRAVVRSVVKTIPKIMPRLTPKPKPAPEAVE
jgi:AsmA protein